MRPFLALPLLPLLLAGCDSATDSTTCLRATVSYAGVASGPTYVKVAGSDGSLYLAQQAASPAAVAADPPRVCFASPDGQVSLTAVAWIDLSGGAPAGTCVDLTADVCAPAPADPQGSGGSVLHPGESNEVTVVVTDPAPPAAGG
jgi:hypothetical protein